MITIKLPSPDELSIEDWFEQMELALYHAKKAYEKFSKDMEEKEKEHICMYFRYPEMENNKKFHDLTMNEEIPFEDTQEIELVISY